MSEPSQPARVLHLIDGSGYSEHFRMFAKHSDRERFTTTLASVGPAGVLQENAAEWGLDSFALGAEGTRSLASLVPALARELRRRRVDVLHTHLFRAGIVGTAAGRLARVPVVLATGHHQHEILLSARRAVRTADRIANAVLAHGVVSPSRWMADRLVEGEHVRRDRLHVIPHGIELDRVAADDDGRTRTRREWGVEDRLVVGTVGRLYWVKAHDRLLRAVASLRDRYPDLALVVVGDGDTSALRREAARLGVTDALVLAGQRWDMGNVLAAFDVAAHPAVAESFGITIVEAMLAGKPLVTSRVGIAGDLVEHGVNGILVDPTGDGAMVTGLAELLARRDEWTALGEQARRAAAPLTPERMVRAHEELYVSALHGRRASVR